MAKNSRDSTRFFEKKIDFDFHATKIILHLKCKQILHFRLSNKTFSWDKQKTWKPSCFIFSLSWWFFLTKLIHSFTQFQNLILTVCISFVVRFCYKFQPLIRLKKFASAHQKENYRTNPNDEPSFDNRIHKEIETHANQLS